jgi:hypothetical protein
MVGPAAAHLCQVPLALVLDGLGSVGLLLRVGLVHLDDGGLRATAMSSQTSVRHVTGISRNPWV